MSTKKSKSKYERKILTEISRREYQPVSVKRLAKLLGVPADEMQEFYSTVKQLHRNGRLIVGEDKTIHFPVKPGTIVGTYWAHEKGFGFLIPSDPKISEDLYIPKGASRGALTGDLVQARVFYRRVGRKVKAYGEIIKILSRGRNRFVGLLTRAGDRWLVKTNSRVLHKPVIVEDVGAKAARSGDKVLVRLIEYPVGDKLPRGVIEEVLGEAGLPSVEIRSVIKEYDLPSEFSPKAIKELDKIIEYFNSIVHKEDKLLEGRLDLSDRLLITIDPPDAKDFDDAISIDVLDDGYELGVHIADVSFFVKEGSWLDKEARERGNSVYLPRYVIPMLPEALSNGLCSLQEGEKRLAKSVFIRYDHRGKRKDFRLANTLIVSKKRLTYDQVTAVLEGNDQQFPSPIIELIKRAENLARLIFDRRYKEGMLHLDLPDIELEFNEKGEVVDAHPEDTSFSHTIIEMFMVEANEVVAELLDSYNIPFLRRIHPPPDPQTLEQLKEFLGLLGYDTDKELDRFSLQELVEKARGRPESFAVNYSILRSLQKAVYSPDPIGHYALASRHYCHFTSPIRRYPDLTVHRLVELHLKGRLKSLAKKLQGKYDEYKAIGEHCSFTEQRAEDAERDVKESLVLQLLSHHIGDVFDGIITGVGSIGVFVRISKYMIEGLVPLAELGSDRWSVDAERGIILGRRSGAIIKIGDPMKVRIVSVDTTTRHLNLEPLDFVPSSALPKEAAKVGVKIKEKVKEKKKKRKAKTKGKAKTKTKIRRKGR